MLCFFSCRFFLGAMISKWCPSRATSPKDDAKPSNLLPLVAQLAKSHQRGLQSWDDGIQPGAWVQQTSFCVSKKIVTSILFGEIVCFFTTIVSSTTI